MIKVLGLAVLLWYDYIFACFNYKNVIFKIVGGLHNVIVI